MSENQPSSPTGLKGTENLSRLRLGIAAARFNETLVALLIEDALTTFFTAGVNRKRIKVLRVPGAHELPFAVNMLCRRGRFDAILALGVVIGGDTEHHRVIAYSISQAFQRIAIDRCTPVINGVIVTEDREQAQARCRGKQARGTAFAQTALAMALLQDEDF